MNQLLQEAEFAVPVLQFTKDMTPGTFTAEYAVDNDNIIYHFYPPPAGLLTHFWKVLFAKSLEKVAAEEFGVGHPRLVAAYTEEVSSWWLKARGFANVGDVALRSQNFFKKLDEDFSNEITKARQGGR